MSEISITDTKGGTLYQAYFKGKYLGSSATLEGLYMKKNVSKYYESKKDIVINSILSSITKFEINTKDDHFVDWCEDLRDYVCKFKNKETQLTNEQSEKEME